MKQARFWLLLAAAMLLPQAAFAQPKKPGGKPPAAAPAKPPPAAPAPAAGGDLGDIDEPAKPADSGTPPAGAAAGDAPAAGASSGGICEIDPSACPKQGDLDALAKKDVNAKVYAVQQIYALRRGRVELMPYFSVSLNDQFVTHTGPGLGVNYYLTNVLAVGLNGTFHQPFNGDSDFNFQNRRATHLSVPLNEYQGVASVNFTYVPMYGKFSGFSQFIFHYDGYIVGGVGALRSRPIAVIDPDNRKFDWDTNVAFSLGLGLRIFLNRWFAVTAEIRDYVYSEHLENIQVQGTPAEQQDKKNWYGDSQLTNNVQAQLGISIFLPFSWEYRLPK
jgi:outer membrane beta-barrel protein